MERVTIVPRNATARFDAIISVPDPGRGRSPERSPSAGFVRLVWTGQRRISGIDPGIELAFEGMISVVDGMPTIYNPRYEIIGRPEEIQ